jgi:hypothetical protein
MLDEEHRVGKPYIVKNYAMSCECSSLPEHHHRATG